MVANWTGIPVSRLQEGERAKLIKMEARLGDRVIGQAAAISAVVPKRILRMNALLPVHADESGVNESRMALYGPISRCRL